MLKKQDVNWLPPPVKHRKGFFPNNQLYIQSAGHLKCKGHKHSMMFFIQTAINWRYTQFKRHQSIALLAIYIHTYVWVQCTWVSRLLESVSWVYNTIYLIPDTLVILLDISRYQTQVVPTHHRSQLHLQGGAPQSCLLLVPFTVGRNIYQEAYASYKPSMTQNLVYTYLYIHIYIYIFLYTYIYIHTYIYI